MNDCAASDTSKRPKVDTLALKRIIADLLRESAEKFVLPRFQNLKPKDVTTKSSTTDFVTIADQQSEAWLTSQLLALQLGKVIGEEATSIKLSTRENIPCGYCWTVDPLDGTKNFVRGQPGFCSMVALLWNGKPVEAWIWQPLNKILFYASEEKGAFRISSDAEVRLALQRRPINVDLMRGSGNAMGLIEPKKTVLQKRLKNLIGRKFHGSAGIQACLIASGKEDFLFHGNSTPWDHAPVDLLCREAGGHAAMIDNGERFHASMSAPFMAASSYKGWRSLEKVLWLD